MECCEQADESRCKSSKSHVRPKILSLGTNLTYSFPIIHLLRLGVMKPMLTEVLFKAWKINRERAIDYLNMRNRIYVINGYAGWDKKYRINVRDVCAHIYHALFMQNAYPTQTRRTGRLSS